MKTTLYTIFVVLISIVSPVIGDMLMVGWLSLGVADVTGNYFLLGILPIEMVAVGMTTLALFTAYKHRATLYMPLYLVASVVVHFFYLQFLGNPMSDIGAYLAGVLIGCAIWFSLMWRLALSK